MPMDSSETVKGKFCQECNAPATHIYGTLPWCCECHQKWAQNELRKELANYVPPENPEPEELIIPEYEQEFQNALSEQALIEEKYDSIKSEIIRNLTLPKFIGSFTLRYEPLHNDRSKDGTLRFKYPCI